jgi:hypothetical protein
MYICERFTLVLIIKIAENGLKAIGIIAGAEIVNQVSDSAQDDDTKLLVSLYFCWCIA